MYQILETNHCDKPNIVAPKYQYYVVTEFMKRSREGLHIKKELLLQVALPMFMLFETWLKKKPYLKDNNIWLFIFILLTVLKLNYSMRHFMLSFLFFDFDVICILKAKV